MITETGKDRGVSGKELQVPAPAAYSSRLTSRLPSIFQACGFLVGRGKWELQLRLTIKRYVRTSQVLVNAGGQEVQQRAAINPAELAAAIQVLGLALQAASQYDPSLPDHRRKHVVQALVGVNQLIAALFPNKPMLPVTLIDLACALKDLDRGIVSPMLKPAEVGHRPPNALSAELFRALPAAAMSLEMQAGKSRKDASHEIAARLNRMGYRDSLGNPIEGAQVAKWREKMMTERAAENLAVARYELALEQVKGMAPGEAAKFLLTNMPALNPPTIPKKATS